jgi:hypothetical protein cdifQCD-6_19373
MKGELNMNNLMVFENQKVEVFEFEGKVLFNPYDVGRCLELTDSAVRMAIKGMNSKQVMLMKNPDVNTIDIRKLNPRGENFLTESGVYKLIFRSRKKEAERFCDWVTDEVLPTIRQTGKYETNSNVVSAHNLELPSIQRKLYNGKPVLLRRDLEKVLGLTNNDINYIARSNKIGFAMLSGKELDKFKAENPNAGLNMLSNIRLYNKEDVLKVAKSLKVCFNDEVLDQYFYEELSDFDKLWRVDFARSIENLAYRINRDSPYSKMLIMVASKIYMDCGLLDKVYDDISQTNLVGHNLLIKTLAFRDRVKQKLI